MGRRTHVVELWNQEPCVVSFLETQHKDPGQGVSVLEPRELMTILLLHLQLKGILAYLHTFYLKKGKKTIHLKCTQREKNSL